MLKRRDAETAHANPYFAHQGQPELRHHNNESAPTSPPDTPELKVAAEGADKAATRSEADELARLVAEQVAQY